MLPAQPIIEASGFTAANSQLEYSNAGPLWQPAFDLETAGEGIDWNLDDFTAIAQAPEQYLPLSNLGFFYQFVFGPTQNPHAQASHYIEFETPDVGELGEDIPFNFSDIYSFYRNDNNGYYQVGVSFTIEGLPLLTPYDHTDRIYSFPMAYGDMDTSYVEYLIDIPLLGSYGQNGWRYNHVDAWGTLTANEQTYDVLRVRAERLLTDTINIPQFELLQSVERPLQVDYSWISPDIEGELLRISTVDGLIISAQLYNPTLTMTDNTAEASTDLHIWPNPSSDFCRLDLPASRGTLEVFDMRGTLIHATTTTGDTHQLSTTSWAEGLYLMRFADPTGRISTGKLLRAVQ